MTAPYRDTPSSALARVEQGDRLRRKVAKAIVRFGEAVRRRYVLEYDVPPPKPPTGPTVEMVGGVPVCYRPGMFAGKEGLDLLMRIFGDGEPVGT